MSRTTIYKGLYFVYLTVAGGIGLLVIWRYRFSPVAILLVGMVLLVPGRILGFFWKDLLRGLRLLNSHDYAVSKACSERFLQQIGRRPWLKHLVWLGTSSYSRDPEVLALNNLGAAELGLGEFEPARSHLDRAIAIDPECPLPYFNIGILHHVIGDDAKAKEWFAEAERRGYSKKASDRFFAAVQARFAATDGRGR